MTPNQFARAECANFSICPACSVEQWRCDYFEKYVLPLADSPNLGAAAKVDFQRARDQYRSQHGLGQKFTTYRKCACGAEIGARVKYCPTCARNIRRERERERLRRLRNEPLV